MSGMCVARAAGEAELPHMSHQKSLQHMLPTVRVTHTLTFWHGRDPVPFIVIQQAAVSEAFLIQIK